jgi:hypothetical protein
MDQGVGPLCPGLYELLRREFGDVGIANPGDAFVAGGRRWNSIAGRTEQDVIHAGEFYTVNCPYCGDTRKRLWFNHTYGQLDDDGRIINWRVLCYNEGCLSGNDRRAVENREDLEIRLFNAEIRAADRRFNLAILPGKRGDDGPLTAVEMPGLVVGLDRLPHDHEAVRYMDDRGYDVGLLGRKYGLCYCRKAFEFHQAQGRIVIPIEMDGLLVGWQARYVGELDWKETGVRKYYNLPGMKKRKMLYNWDRASRGGVVVIVEGVTSVWTIGDAGTALLGKSITAHQMQLLIGLAPAGGRPRCLVLMLDPDADQDHKERRRLDAAFSSLTNTYLKTGGAAVRVHLPKGKDPGDFDHETIWDMIYNAGDDRRVDVAGFA